MRDPGFGNGEVRQVGEAAGITFYAAKNAGGDYCIGIGFAVTPSIDALNCGPAIDSVVNGTSPIEDFSSTGTAAGSTTVTRLAGFANAPATEIAVVDSNGNALYSTPVVNGLYAASTVPQHPATAILAYDASGDVIYRRPLIAPPPPQPAMPSPQPPPGNG